MLTTEEIRIIYNLALTFKENKSSASSSHTNFLDEFLHTSKKKDGKTWIDECRKSPGKMAHTINIISEALALRISDHEGEYNESLDDIAMKACRVFEELCHHDFHIKRNLAEALSSCPSIIEQLSDRVPLVKLIILKKVIDEYPVDVLAFPMSAKLSNWLSKLSTLATKYLQEDNYYRNLKIIYLLIHGLDIMQKTGERLLLGYQGQLPDYLLSLDLDHFLARFSQESSGVIDSFTDAPLIVKEQVNLIMTEVKSEFEQAREVIFESSNIRLGC